MNRNRIGSCVALLTFLMGLKFTVPIVLGNPVGWSPDPMFWVIGVWPNEVYLVLTLLVFALGMDVGRNVWRMRIPVLIPALWIGVQLIAALSGKDVRLGMRVCLYETTLIGAYFIGYQGIQSKKIAAAWLVSAIVLCFYGLYHALGGLESLREYLAAHPEIAEQNPDLNHKVLSNRIFATFISPNSYAGFLIMSICWMGAVWKQAWKGDSLQRWSLLLLTIAILFCLWKTGSKGGYLSICLTGGLALLIFGGSGWKMGGLAIGLGMVAVIGFYFLYGMEGWQAGMRTWGARLDYWSAAIRMGSIHPVLGWGPGGFMRQYAAYQSPGAEGTRLAHNTVLQMFSDSGFSGALSFLFMFPGLLIWSAWQNRLISWKNRIPWICVWASVLAFTLHGLVDFDFYIPGLAWLAFLSLGMVCSPAGLTFESEERMQSSGRRGHRKG